MSNEALYQQRYDRIKKAIALEPVDQVPVVLNGPGFFPRFVGMSIAEYSSHPARAAAATLAALQRLDDVDGVNGGTVFSPYLLSGLWLSRVKVPGKDLPPESLWQVQEAEMLTPEDYDLIIDKGWQASLGEFLPRVVNMADFGAAVGWIAENTPRLAQEFREAGFVIVCDAAANTAIPFEPLCGGRSMQKFFIDLYRMPDKIKAAMDVIQAEQLAAIKAVPPVGGIRGTWVGGWRTASAMVAPRLWDKFVWPYILEQVEALVAVGVTPVLHWDQDWTRDLVRLQELPAKKVILNPDGMTDVRKFKELAGDRMAMMGDVPASLFAAGTPDDMRQYVRGLVELFEGRGLILCPGCDAPINTKPENMEAFVEACHEYGKVA